MIVEKNTNMANTRITKKVRIAKPNTDGSWNEEEWLIVEMDLNITIDCTIQLQFTDLLDS